MGIGFLLGVVCLDWEDCSFIERCDQKVYVIVIRDGLHLYGGVVGIYDL